jgi:hypothetical protein
MQMMQGALLKLILPKIERSFEIPAAIKCREVYERS